MDIFDKINAHKGPLGQYADVAEGYYMFPKLRGQISNRMEFNGKERIIWSLNNYLGLANHPEVRKADAEGAKEWGLAYPMGARMMSGNSDMIDELERRLAAHVKKPSALLVNFGYQGMASGVDCLLGRNDVAVYDSESHACIIDGLRMHMGKRLVYDHNDMQSLEKNLQRAEKICKQTKGGILVISEGVFGMRGDQGDLKGIVALKKKYKFRILIDDAHGYGTLGKTGAGAGEEQGVQDEIDVYFSTFAKSMSSIGAFFAGNEEIIKYMKYNMRSQMFAKTLPMPFIVGNLKRLELLQTKPELKAKLWENVNLLQTGLKERGFNIGNTNSCVTPVYLKGSISEATNLTYDLRENFNIFCSMVMYPVVPKGMMILRLIPTAVHTEEDIKLTLDAFEAVANKLNDGIYAKMDLAAMTLS